MSRLTSVTLRSLVRGICAPRTNARSTLHTRTYCQSAKPSVTTNEASAVHRLFINKKRPTAFDKKVLVWAGRFKKQEDIPEFVSLEAISGSRSNLRIKVCMAMILSTIVGCVFMVRSGKKALREDDTLFKRNMEKKAKLKAETAQDQPPTLKSH